jgi:hypothetical protein
MILVSPERFFRLFSLIPVMRFSQYNLKKAFPGLRDDPGRLMKSIISSYPITRRRGDSLLFSLFSDNPHVFITLLPGNPIDVLNHTSYKLLSREIKARNLMFNWKISLFRNIFLTKYPA